MTLGRSLLTAVIAGGLVVGCADGVAPTQPIDVVAPSLRAESTGWVDVNFTRGDNCNGELVDWTTRRKIVTNSHSDGNGGFHFGLHRAWIGTGVGQTSGTVYSFNWPNQIQEHVGSTPYTFTRRIANNLVSRGGAENRIFSLLEHVTINANGDVTVEINNLTLECVG